MIFPGVAATTVPSVPTSPSDTATTPGWRSHMMRANVWTAARLAALGIGCTLAMLSDPTTGFKRDS